MTDLALALQVAVPLEVDRLKGTSPVELVRMTRGFPQLIGTYGDQFIYGGPHAGEVFAAVATGIAALLLTSPGGIDLFGVHFCDPSGDECVDIHGRCPRSAA